MHTLDSPSWFTVWFRCCRRHCWKAYKCCRGGRELAAWPRSVTECPSRPHTLTSSLSLSLNFNHTRMLSILHSIRHSRIQSYILTCTFTHTQSYSFTHTNKLTHGLTSTYLNTHTLSHLHTPTHSHIHPHTRTYMGLKLNQAGYYCPWMTQVSVTSSRE